MVLNGVEAEKIETLFIREEIVATSVVLCYNVLNRFLCVDDAAGVFVMKAEMVFFAGARKEPPYGWRYPPHFVVKGTKDHLGMSLDITEKTEFEARVVSEVGLLYEGVDYTKLVKGASFFIMEGAKTVGEGVIIE